MTLEIFCPLFLNLHVSERLVRMRGCSIRRDLISTYDHQTVMLLLLVLLQVVIIIL